MNKKDRVPLVSVDKVHRFNKLLNIKMIRLIKFIKSKMLRETVLNKGKYSMQPKKTQKK
jgi:hypothetical protein